MYLRFARRRKDGKEHRYWSIVESRRCAGGRVVQRPVLYLGEINDSQHAAWCRVIEGFDEGSGRHRQLALFAAEQGGPDHAKGFGVQVRLDAMELHRPRQWGACWLACHLYEQLQLDRFFAPLLPNSREGTSWQHILQTLVCYRLIDPGSEWRLHRQWFEHSAMADLLGEDYALAERNALYRCLDKLLPHKEALFSHLRARWQDLFAAKFDVLLYDLTSTYFESPPPDDDADKRRHGYSRDKRSDCVQVVIALIVTPAGFPLAYEVRKARGARIGAFGRIPINPMGNAVVANLEAAVVLVDGLDLLDFGRRRGCEIAFDLGMKRRLVALDGEQVVGPGIEGRLGDGDLAVHGIGRDQGTLEIEPLDQSRYRGGLVGFFKYRLLAKHKPAVGREGRHQVERIVAGSAIVSAPRGLAVDCHEIELVGPACRDP